MAEFVRGRRLSPAELVQAHLRQIDSANPRVNAFLEVYAGDALAAARQAESLLLRREESGPLFGVPVTVKDSFDVAGRFTACGSRLRLAERASADSVAVQRLRRAGAILLGRTSCPEFLMNYETDNHLIGPTRNPYDEHRTSGGSSGGEAAAIATFCSPGGIGSDGGGSVRVPAAFCGICGLKPTPGRIPAVGHWPLIQHPSGFMGVAGPMARSARDVRILFEVLAGDDPRDPFSAPVPLRAPGPGPLRVAVMERFNHVPVQQPQLEAVRRATALLSDLSCAIEEFDSTSIDRAPNLWWFLFGELAAPLLRAYIGGREAECHWTGLEFIDQFRDRQPPTAVALCEVLAERDRMRAGLLARMGEGWVILAPACGVTAFPHRARRYQAEGREIGLFQAMMPLTPWNLLGFPAIVVPIGKDPGGLPTAVQLIGPPWSDELLLDLAIRLEDAV
jgi:amidase